MRVANHMAPWGTRLSEPASKCYRVACKTAKETTMSRPRRSLLFMPGSNARALEKARNLPADGIILDLEDSVAPDAKATARDQIAQAIAARGFGKREVLIRINALDSPWWVDDVGMAGKARPDGILVPKISSVQDLTAIADRLSDINADTSIRVWAMIETAH